MTTKHKSTYTNKCDTIHTSKPIWITQNTISSCRFSKSRIRQMYTTNITNWNTSSTSIKHTFTLTIYTGLSFQYSQIIHVINKLDKHFLNITERSLCICLITLFSKYPCTYQPSFIYRIINNSYNSICRVPFTNKMIGLITRYFTFFKTPMQWIKKF